MVFFPFKMTMIYKKRKAKLLAQGIQPMFLRVIFTAPLLRARSLYSLS
jgi:hypothetical protein